MENIVVSDVFEASVWEGIRARDKSMLLPVILRDFDSYLGWINVRRYFCLLPINQANHQTP